MFFFFFEFPEARPENDPAFTNIDFHEINSVTDIQQVKYNRITDIKDLLRLLVISRCTYLRGCNDIDFHGIVDFDTDLRKLFEPFDKRLGLSPNGTSIKDLYCNFLNYYDRFSRSNPDDIISECQPKGYESAPISYLKKRFGFDEETALIEYYLIYVSFDLYHDEPINEVFQKYVDLSNGRHNLRRTEFNLAVKELFFKKLYSSSEVLSMDEVYRHYGRVNANTTFQRALVYYYAVLYRDFRAAEYYKDNSLKGLRVKEQIPEFFSPQAVFTLTYKDCTYRPLNAIFTNTVYPSFKKGTNWEKDFTELLITLSGFSLELYINEFLPYLFVSPNTVITYLKSVPHYTKHSIDRNAMEIIIAFLYARSEKNPLDAFRDYLRNKLLRETEIDYKSVYEHLERFSGTLSVSKSRLEDRYYNTLSPIMKLFKSGDGKALNNIAQKLLDVYMNPDGFKDGLDENLLKQLEKIPALDYLRIIDENSNDSMVEDSILFETYANSIVLSERKSALLVQPSYSFLQKWVTDYRTKNIETTVILYDREVIDCLSHALEHDRLVSWDKYSLKPETHYHIRFLQAPDKGSRFDIALSFYNRVPTKPEDLEIIIQMMDHHSALYAVIPEDALSDEKYICLRKWFFSKLSIEHITLLDSQLFGYQPKKKMMIQCSQRNIYAEQNADVPVTEYEINKELHKKTKNGKKVRPDGFLYYLNRPVETRLKLNDGFINDNIGIRELLRKQHLPDHIIPRGSAKKVTLASDYTVYYTASPHGKAIQVNCYYTRYLNPVRQKNNQKGKKIPESTVIFTVNDENEAAPMILDDVLYRDKFRKVVSEEIRSSHKSGILPDLSVFSYAYAYPEEIKKRFQKYDNNYCLKWLSHNHIGSLVFNSPSFSDDLQNALAETNPLSEKLIEQLSYILDSAARDGFIIKDYGSISRIIDEEKKRHNTKIAFHKALTTKSLPFEREKQLVEWLLEKISENIVYLGTMIKLFTGLSTPEVCMLSWSDFAIIKGSKEGDTEYKQLRITKQMRYESTEADSLKTSQKYRLVPLPSILDKLLSDRKEELKEKYDLSDEEIKALPIISFDTENYFDRCKVKRLRDKSADALRKGAGLKKKEIKYLEPEGTEKVDDLNKYIGDFYVSNFKFHARYDCSMTEGEISYILGIQPPDTFSMHYCDYSNDYVQIGLAKKLNDWYLKYVEWNGEPVIERKKTLTDSKTRNALIKPFSSDCAAGFLEFPLNHENAAPIEITISSDRGLSGTLSVYRTGGKDGK